MNTPSLIPSTRELVAFDPSCRRSAVVGFGALSMARAAQRAAVGGGARRTQRRALAQLSSPKPVMHGSRFFRFAALTALITFRGARLVPTPPRPSLPGLVCVRGDSCGRTRPCLDSREDTRYDERILSVVAKIGHSPVRSAVACALIWPCPRPRAWGSQPRRPPVVHALVFCYPVLLACPPSVSHTHPLSL